MNTTTLLYLLPQHFLTRCAGWLSRRRWPWFKRYCIRWFIRRYHVDMTDAISQNIDSYPTFNAFFCRALRPGCRPLAVGEGHVISPVDGVISQCGAITGEQLLQAKGHHYTLTDLLTHTKSADAFKQGHYCTLYLAPHDYHRVHMPVEGELRRMRYVPGRLFAVNAQSAQQVSRLFTRNERVICEFDTAFGPMAVILVGAYVVGNIHTRWAGQVAPNGYRVREWSYARGEISLTAGMELGHFTMGSTVIVLWGSGYPVHFSQPVDSPIKMGERLARMQ